MFARRISRQAARWIVISTASAAGAVWVLTAGPGTGWAEPAAAESLQNGSAWTVGQGDSWFSMRSRICPVESLQEANPELASRSLRAGDRIRSPFVAVDQVETLQLQLAEAERARSEARQQAQQERAEAAEIRDRLQAQEAELGALRSERDELLASRSGAWILQLGLGACIVVLLAGLAAALSMTYATRRAAQLREQRLKEVEAQYTELRRSVMDLDVQLQRRMLKLLSWHETRVLTEREVEEAAAPVVDMARKLKERHAS